MEFFLAPNPMLQAFLYEDGVYTPITFCLEPVSELLVCGDTRTQPLEILDNGDVVGRFQAKGVIGPGPTLAEGDFVWRDGVFYTDDAPGFPRFPPGRGLPEPSSLLLL